MKGELSGRQYPIDALTRLWLARHIQNQSRINLMRRIFKPSPPPPWRGFSLVTDCQLEPQVASARPFIPQGGQEGGLIRRIGFIREPFERVRTEPNAKEQNNVVLSSRLNKVIGNRK